MDYLICMGRAIGADGARFALGKDPIVVDVGMGRGPTEIARVEITESRTAESEVREFSEGELSVSVEYFDLYRDEPPRVGNIVDGYHAAIAARDRAALDLLGQAPLEALFAAKPYPAGKAVTLPYALGVRALLRQESGYERYFHEALEGCRSESDPEIRNYAMFLDAPSIDLALRLKLSDEEAAAQGIPTFDATLRKALTDHRHYYRDCRQNDDEPMHNDPDGFLALPLLAWASFRFDLGFPVSIRSDYLPQTIVEHQPRQKLGVKIGGGR